MEETSPIGEIKGTPKDERGELQTNGVWKLTETSSFVEPATPDNPDHRTHNVTKTTFTVEGPNDEVYKVTNTNDRIDVEGPGYNRTDEVITNTGITRNSEDWLPFQIANQLIDRGDAFNRSNRNQLVRTLDTIGSNYQQAVAKATESGDRLAAIQTAVDQAKDFTDQL